MNTQNFDIRELTPQEPLRSRAERRERVRTQEREARKSARRLLREVRAVTNAERVYATDKPVV